MSLMDTLKIDLFSKTPTGRALAAEIEASEKASRESLVAQRDQLLAEQAETLGRLRKKHIAAQDAFDKAKAACDAAAAKLTAAKTERSSADYGFERRLTKLETALQETAPAEVDRFIESLRGEIAKLNTGINEKAETGTNAFGHTVQRWMTNRPTTERRCEFLTKAIEAVNEMRFALLDGPELADKLDDLVANAPAVKFEVI